MPRAHRIICKKCHMHKLPKLQTHCDTDKNEMNTSKSHAIAMNCAKHTAFRRKSAYAYVVADSAGRWRRSLNNACEILYFHFRTVRSIVLGLRAVGMSSAMCWRHIVCMVRARGSLWRTPQKAVIYWLLTEEVDTFANLWRAHYRRINPYRALPRHEKNIRSVLLRLTHANMQQI